MKRSKRVGHKTFSALKLICWLKIFKLDLDFDPWNNNKFIQIGATHHGKCFCVGKGRETGRTSWQDLKAGGLFCLFGWLVGFLMSSSTTRLDRGGSQHWCLTILRAATHETEQGDHNFCLRWSHNTDIHSTSRGLNPRSPQHVMGRGKKRKPKVPITSQTLII